MSIVEQKLTKGMNIAIGKAYLKRGEPDWAMKAIELEGMENFKSELLCCGEDCFKKGNIDGAVKCFQMLGDKAKLLECCEHFIKQGLVNKAFKVFKAAVLLK